MNLPFRLFLPILLLALFRRSGWRCFSGRCLFSFFFDTLLRRLTFATPIRLRIYHSGMSSPLCHSLLPDQKFSRFVALEFNSDSAVGLTFLRAVRRIFSFFTLRRAFLLTPKPLLFLVVCAGDVSLICSFESRQVFPFSFGYVRSDLPLFRLFSSPPSLYSVLPYLRWDHIWR